MSNKKDNQNDNELPEQPAELQEAPAELQEVKEDKVTTEDIIKELEKGGSLVVDILNDEELNELYQKFVDSQHTMKCELKAVKSIQSGGARFYSVKVQQ